MEFKGTKGKWKARIGYAIDVVVDDDSAFGIVDMGTEQEAFLADYPVDELKANAKLIAAAPELLEACLKLVQRLESDCPWWLLDNRDEIESAIKKALGGE